MPFFYAPYSIIHTGDELKHALWIHDVAVAEVEKLKQVYQPPVEMLEKWEEAHKHYVEKAAWIKTMLAM